MPAHVHADPPPPVLYDATGQQYQTEKQLGRGGFAICWRAQQTNGSRTQSKTVALKIVRSEISSRRLAQKFVTELQLHSKLHHPNIVEFYRAFSFQSSTYVVLEICLNGSLADCLKKRLYLSMPEVRRYIIQTCGAVKYLHTQNIVHRDLKTGNLFLDSNMNIKVGDFGLAAVLVGPDDAVMRRTTMCGTPNYIAPELLEKDGRGHNEKVDIWAIGIIAYTLAVGRAPFHASKPEDVLTKVAKGEYAWPSLGKHKNNISDDLCALVSQILVDENSRPSLDTIVSHRFLKLGYMPETLDSDALVALPTWTIKPPSPATLMRGYTDAWYNHCKASGVGEYTAGKFFSATNSTSGSIYRECQREAEVGKMPIVPLPHGALYTPFVSKKRQRHTGGLDIQQLSSISTPLLESSVNNKCNLPGPVEIQLCQPGDAEFRNENPPKSLCAKSPAFSYAETAQTARRPAASCPKSALQKTIIPTAGPASMQSEAEPTSGMIAQYPTQPSNTRPSRASGNPHPPRNIVQTEVITSKPVRPIRTISRSITRADAAKFVAPVALREPALQITEPLSQPVRTLLSSKVTASVSKKVTPQNGSLLNIYSDPVTILNGVKELWDNINTALSSSANGPSALRNWNPPTNPLPFVSNWIDYSTKLGIGYILADGSIGVAINHTNKQLTHTFIDNGYKYLQTIRDKFAFKSAPFRILTQTDDGSLEEANMSEADRNQNIIWWARFGRYMHQNFSDPSLTRIKEKEQCSDNIVRYYQRIGNVSVWGFSNGCFQFNFPDHTKIVLSADGRYISFTALPLSAITHMATYPDTLPAKFIKDREVICGTIYQLLYGPGKTSRSTSTEVKIDVLALTAANALPAKLGFVVKVIGNWVSGGGLGCKAARTRWPSWDGVSLKNLGGSKMSWITVGRFGGDGFPNTDMEKEEEEEQEEGRSCRRRRLS